MINSIENQAQYSDFAKAEKLNAQLIAYLARAEELAEQVVNATGAGIDTARLEDAIEEVRSTQSEIKDALADFEQGAAA